MQLTSIGNQNLLNRFNLGGKVSPVDMVAVDNNASIFVE